jgi:ribosomal protein L9
LKHTVRIILVDDLPTGKAYRGDVIHVAAGYMRNYLFPKKIALYATPQNFERLGRKDPDSETAEERRQRLERMASDELNEDLKAANLLTKYLNGKMVSFTCFYES